MTFFNFLRMNVIPDQEGNSDFSTSEETIKAMINREYQFYFKRSDEKVDLYRPSNAIIKRLVMNDVNRRFRVEFA